MEEPGLNRLLLALTAGDFDRQERAEGTTTPTPFCPPLPRFRTAVLREDWTDAEQRHQSTCIYCQRTETQARSLVWHPTLVELFWHLRELPGQKNVDIPDHLDQDSCRRCHRLAAIFQADRLLGRVARQARQGVTKVVKGLRDMLSSGAAGYFAPHLATPAGECRLTLEDRRTTFLGRLGQPVLHLEQRELPADRPRLMHLLTALGPETHERLVLLRPEKNGEMQVADLSLDRPLAEHMVLALFEVQVGLLARDDLEPLRAAYQEASKQHPAMLAAWQSWASQALKHPELTTALRPLLMTMTRPDGKGTRRQDSF